MKVPKASCQKIYKPFLPELLTSCSSWFEIAKALDGLEALKLRPDLKIN